MNRGRQLFGTDGIRGIAGEFPLDPASVYAFGRALGRWLKQQTDQPRVLLGMDTRESSPTLVMQVAAGLRREQARPIFAGVITTPGVAWLTRTMGFDAGVVVSASHNPYRDNGLKVFGPDGFKLPDQAEQELEGAILELRQAEPKPLTQLEPLAPQSSLTDAYLEWLYSHGPQLDGMKIVVDAGHGAASQLAPRLLTELGATVHSIGCEPDGRNINAGYGALFPERAQQEVLQTGAQLGVSFDGDGDRAIFTCSTGRIVDGDAVLWLCARWYLEEGWIANPARVVVGTVMSNFALEKALAERGIRLVRAPVGDKYVLEEMLRHGAILGGEPSGHVIFLRLATTGDGLLTLLQVLRRVAATGDDLATLVRDYRPYPQHLINVRFQNRPQLDNNPAIQSVVEQAERKLAGRGRLVVRVSGTEPVVRIMVEAESEQLAVSTCEEVANAIRSAIESG